MRGESTSSRDGKWVGLGFALLASCGTHSPDVSTSSAPTVDIGPASAATSAERAAPEAGPARCFVGRLRQNAKMDHFHPADFCVDGRHFEGASYRLSRLNLFGVEALPADWLGQYVMVPAVRRENLASRLRETGPCPEGEPFPIQARSDWSPEEGGYLTRLERLAQADYLDAEGDPKLVSLMNVQRPEPPKRGRKRGAPEPSRHDAEVVVEIENTLEVPLEGLRLAFHYEGGPRKPMPHYDVVPVRRLAPRARQTLRRPAAVERPIGGGETSWWHFESVSLEGRAGDCEILPSTFRR